MKAEINNKNRVKFESNYILQDVFRTSRDPNESGILTPRLLARPFSKYDWLELKPLSLISDEDLLWCYHKNSELIAYDYTMDFKSFLEMANHWKSSEEDWERSVTKYTQIADYLRSKGYALPYLGLSVSEMVEAGWIKLTK